MENIRKNIALLIIDMQYDFLSKNSPLFVNDCKDVIMNIKEILTKFREKNLTRIFIKREHRKSGVDIDLVRLEIFKKSGVLLENEFGSQIVDDLKPKNDEIVIVKRRFSAFFGTELDLILRRLGIKTLILSGIQTPNCIRATAFDGISYDYEVIVFSDATKSKNEKTQIQNLLDMQDAGIKILSTKDILNMLNFY